MCPGAPGLKPPQLGAPPQSFSLSSWPPPPQEAAGGALCHRGGGPAATLNPPLHGSSVTRSRLADFHANCRASYQTLTSCPADNYQACLGSYAGMIGKPRPACLGSQWAPGAPGAAGRGRGHAPARGGTARACPSLRQLQLQVLWEARGEAGAFLWGGGPRDLMGLSK